jgi:thiol-disulfide isomerase/thioredoxin
MELQLQGKRIPFTLEFTDKDVKLFNATEVITLATKIDKNKVTISMQGFDASIELDKSGPVMKGFWIKHNRTPEYKLPVLGMKLAATLKENFKEEKLLPKKWKMKFEGNEDPALLVFTEEKNQLYASIITQTGDYRFLTPRIKEDNLVFYGFDGAYAFYIEGKLKPDYYSGVMYSGATSNTKFSASPDENFSLKDPEQITKYKKDITKLSLPVLSGSKYSIKENLGKVQVLQIFGSWCPNCIDETKFIKGWKSNNKDLGIQFALIAFERSPNKKHALVQLKKAKKTYGIDYPIMIGGYTEEDKVSNVLSGLENFISFPTTIYIDKKGKVRKVLASFQGPATGRYFEDFSRNFDLFLKKLAAE